MSVSTFIMRLPAVRKYTGLSSSTIYELLARGEFPQQTRLSARSVGWSVTEIENWVASRLASRKFGNGRIV